MLYHFKIGVNISVKPEISHLRKQFTHTFSPYLFQVWKCEGKSGTAVDIPLTLCNEAPSRVSFTQQMGYRWGELGEGGFTLGPGDRRKVIMAEPIRNTSVCRGIGGGWAAALSKSLLTNQQRGAEVTAHGRRQLDTLQKCTVNKMGEDRVE